MTWYPLNGGKQNHLALRKWGYLVGGSGNSVSDGGNTLMPIQSSTLSSSKVPVDVIYKGVTVRFPDEP